MWWGIAYCDKEKTIDFTIRTISEGEQVWTIHLGETDKSPLSYAKHDKMYDQVYSLDEGNFPSTVRILQSQGVSIPDDVQRMVAIFSSFL